MEIQNLSSNSDNDNTVMSVLLQANYGFLLKNKKEKHVLYII